MPKTIDASVNQIISQFAQADLHSDDDAFRLWLQKKKANRKLHRISSSSSISTTTTTTQPVSPQQLPQQLPPPPPLAAETAAAALQKELQQQQHQKREHDLSDIKSRVENAARTQSRSTTPHHHHQHHHQRELDNLLIKRARSQQAFLAWVSNKEEQKLTEEETQRQKMQHEKQQQIIKQHQEAQRKERERDAIKRWKLEKAKKEKEMERKLLEERDRQELEMQEKQKLCDQVFSKWKREKEAAAAAAAAAAIVSSSGKSANNSNGNHQNMPFVAHAHRWIDIVTPTLSHSHQNTKTAKGSYKLNQQELLSPPNLYKDYCLYEKEAPNYRIKYPSQVASGGVGLSLSQFETRLMPPPPPPPPQKAPVATPNPRKLKPEVNHNKQRPSKGWR